MRGRQLVRATGDHWWLHGKPTAKDLHEDDLYAWANDQAALLRAGRFDALDLEHLFDEIEDLAGSLKGAVRSSATTVMAHLLKLQHSPAQNPRLAWRETIRTPRTRLLNDLTPRPQRHLVDRLPELYARARHDAEGSLRDHGGQATADALPLRARSDHRRLAAVRRPSSRASGGAG